MTHKQALEMAAQVKSAVSKEMVSLIESIGEEVAATVLGSKPLHSLKEDSIIILQRVETRSSLNGDDYLVAVFVDEHHEEYAVSARALAALKIATTKAEVQHTEWSADLKGVPYLQKLLKENKLKVELGLVLKVLKRVKVHNYTIQRKEQRYVNMAYNGHEKYLEDLSNGIKNTVAHRALMRSGVRADALGQEELLLFKPVFKVITS